MARSEKNPPATPWADPPQKPPAVAEEDDRNTAAFPIVGIGASAGGLEAITQLLQALPEHPGLGFVFIQHLDPSHGSMLTEILSRVTRMPVTEVTSEVLVERDHLYVISPGVDMIISGGCLQLTERTTARGEHRQIDHFFSSLAEDQGFKAIGVILSGGATDGTAGLQTIKAEGGITFAQDASAQHNSMPRSAVSAGAVDFVLPPDQIAAELVRIAQHPYVVPGTAGVAEAPQESNLAQILEVLRHTTGADFTNYKFSTLYRRIARRMVLHKMEGLQDYVGMLQSTPAEIDALYEDILINVTSFFRNPESFEALKQKVFPRLTEERSKHDPVRFWIIGCSTGEEAYSLAMAFAEYCDVSGRTLPIQVFATDLNGASVERARVGIYSREIVHDVNPNRLRRFFVEVDGGYRIAKVIRDMCVFAKHNVLTDPPFSRMDLITCRNLMIYLEPVLQKRLVPTLHYALKPQGFLWMGSSETIGSYRDLFEAEDAKHKIYAKKAGPMRAAVPVPFTHYLRDPSAPVKVVMQREPSGNGIEMQREAERVLLQRFAPPGVLVTADADIVQFRGDTGLFLTPAPGRASLNLLKMLREGLLVGVRGALHRAMKEETAVREEKLRVKSNGGYRDVDVEVLPVKVSGSMRDRCFLVLFHDRSSGTSVPVQTVAALEQPGGSAPVPIEGDEPQIIRLTQELAATREYLQSVIEQQEAANEELQSANEEVQSANEELQSINEELETSKEEIQSSNEELATVNEELQNRNLELSQSNNDLLNLLSSVQMPIVMLGANLRIRRFTPMAERMLNLIPADVGRPISDIKLNIDVQDLEKLLLEVIDTVTVRELEVRDKHGRWFLLRVRPYKTTENKIEGAVMVLVDVDSLKRSEETARRQAELLNQTHEPIIMWEYDGHITYWNRGAETTYGYTGEQALGKVVHELLQTSPSPLTFKESLQTSGRWIGDLTHTRKDGKQIRIESLMVLARDDAGCTLVIETNRDVTQRVGMERTLRERADQLAHADQSKDEFLAMLAHELRNPLAPLRNAVELMKAAHSDAAKVQYAREVIERQVGRMARLVDDLLNVSRITQGKLELQRRLVQANTVLEAAVETARPSFDERGQTLEVKLLAEDLWLNADPLRLEQVFVNLLDNASKYTANGGQIWLTAEPAHASGVRGLSVHVRDNGIGITAEMQPHVFEPFMQSSRALDRSQGGLGIGLTLVKRLVEMHAGTVQVHSDGPGRGSEFVVALPVANAPSKTSAAPLSAPAAAPDDGEARKILVVDDNADAAQSMAMLLSLSGHETRIAHDGNAALDAADSFRPEVILLDIGLPGLDGFEVARRLRTRFNGIRLIALSGYGQSEFRDQAAAAGFDQYLTKPVDSETLRTAIMARQKPQ